MIASEFEGTALWIFAAIAIGFVVVSMGDEYRKWRTHRRVLKACRKAAKRYQKLKACQEEVTS